MHYFVSLCLFAPLDWDSFVQMVQTMVVVIPTHLSCILAHQSLPYNILFFEMFKYSFINSSIYTLN